MFSQLFLVLSWIQYFVGKAYLILDASLCASHSIFSVAYKKFSTLSTPFGPLPVPTHEPVRPYHRTATK